jgi:hypothetical protein
VFALRGSRALFAVLLSVFVLASPMRFLDDSPDKNPIPTQLPGRNAPLTNSFAVCVKWHCWRITTADGRLSGGGAGRARGTILRVGERSACERNVGADCGMGRATDGWMGNRARSLSVEILLDVKGASISMTALY